MSSFIYATDARAPSPSGDHPDRNIRRYNSHRGFTSIRLRIRGLGVDIPLWEVPSPFLATEVIFIQVLVHS